MTREQACDTLRNAAWLGTDEERELIEKAVELLCGEPCEDAISRRAAKEAVKRASASGTVQMLLMEILDGMPSVNPKPCEDAISRQAAIDAIRKDVMGGLNYEGILTRLPSITPTKCIAKITFDEKKMQEMVNNATNRIYECCEDAISRHTAMETFARWAEFKDYTHVERHILHAVVDEIRALPSFAETMAESEKKI